MENDLRNLIKTVLSLGNCSRPEYELVAKHLKSLSPCNALFFGVGHDSKIWDTINAEGNNLFLDNLQEWIEKIRPALGYSNIEKIEYTTKRTQWKKILNKHDLLLVQLPEIVWQTDWDFIFIDAPRGNKDFCPGRMQSIYMASLLVARSTGLIKVLAHDYNRKVEKKYCNKYIGKKYLRKVVRKMAYFKIENSIK